VWRPTALLLTGACETFSQSEGTTRTLHSSVGTFSHLKRKKNIPTFHTWIAKCGGIVDSKYNQISIKKIKLQPNRTRVFDVLPQPPDLTMPDLV
jgi:hypothetical protein